MYVVIVTHGPNYLNQRKIFGTFDDFDMADRWAKAYAILHKCKTEISKMSVWGYSKTVDGVENAWDAS